MLKKLYAQSDYHDKSGMIFNTDCMKFMSDIPMGGVFDVTLTDIPYDAVNTKRNTSSDKHGMRVLNKGSADELTFDLYCEIHRQTVKRGTYPHEQPVGSHLYECPGYSIYTCGGRNASYKTKRKWFI